MNQLWQTEAERMGGQPLVQFLNEIRNNQHDMMACFEQISKQVTDQQAMVERVLSGFPAADVDGHRRYHQSVIDARELRIKLMRAALEKAIGSGFVVGMGWLMLAAWEYIKLELKK